MLRFDRRLLQNVDWLLVAAAAFIIALSVLSLWSLAPGRGGGALAWRQLSWVGVGLVVVGIPLILVAGQLHIAKGQDHAWFASFAPADDPQVVVVVLVERGGKGGQVAAPIARQIYQALFLDKVAMVTLGEGS